MKATIFLKLPQIEQEQLEYQGQDGPIELALIGPADQITIQAKYKTSSPNNKYKVLNPGRNGSLGRAFSLV